MVERQQSLIEKLKDKRMTQKEWKEKLMQAFLMMRRPDGEEKEGRGGKQKANDLVLKLMSR